MRIWSCLFLPLPAVYVSEPSTEHILELEKRVLGLYAECLPERKRIVAQESTAMLMEGMTGWSMERTDVELFARIGEVMSPQQIFVIGNAWGYSTIVLAVIFKGAAIDVIDPQRAGLLVTEEVANCAQLNISVFEGYSPEGIPSAIRQPGTSELKKDGWYQLAFIDGLHENHQLVKDFEALKPFLAKRFVVVLHDVLGSQLEPAVRKCLCTDKEMRFVFNEGYHYKTLTGVGFLYKGFPDEAFANIRSNEGVHTCETKRIGTDLLLKEKSKKKQRSREDSFFDGCRECFSKASDLLQKTNSEAMQAYGVEKSQLKAERMLQDALKYFRYDGHGLEPDSYKSDMLTTRYNLGMVWYGMKHFSKAINVMQDVYREQAEAWGEHHHDAKATKEALDFIMAARQKDAVVEITDL